MMQHVAACMFRRLTALPALMMLMAGCAGGQGSFAPDFFGKSISSMKGPLIETTSFQPGAPSLVGDPRPPRTFFYSGAADEAGDNYWLHEKSRAPIPDASRVIPDGKIRAYLHGIAKSLLAQAPPGAPEVQVHVLADTTYKAFAREDGDVYVSIGVLAQALSEDEVAVLLGHEIGHLLLKHHDKDRIFQKQRDLTSFALGGVFTVLAVTTKLNTGGIVKVNQQGLYQDAAAAAGAKMAFDLLANDVVNASWNRTQENDADLIGIDLAVRAGYDPNQVTVGFSHLIEAAENRKTRLSALSDKAEARLQELQTTMTNAVKVGRVDLKPVIDTGVGMATDAVGAAIADGHDYLADTYQSPKDRSDRALEYLDKFYVGVQQGSDTDYDSVKKRLRIEEINNAYRDVETALIAIADKKFESALTTMKQVYKSQLINDHPTPRLVEAYAYQGLNKPKDALRALDSVSPNIPLTVEGYIVKAELEAQTGSAERALAALNDGVSTYGAESMQPARITVLATLNRIEEAQTAFEDCKELSATTKAACNVAAKESNVGAQTAAGQTKAGQTATGGRSGQGSSFGDALRGTQESLGKTFGF